MAEQKQPRVIKSPDGILQTLHHRMSVNRFGHRVVEGAVKNTGPESGVTAEIKAEYYDASGMLMGTEAETIKLIVPGKTGAFEIVYSGKRCWDVKSYRIMTLQRI